MSPYDSARSRRRRVENEYTRYLKRITRDIRVLLKNETDPAAAANLIRQYADTGAFDEMARKYARNMVTGTYVGNKATWRAAAAESMRGREIFEALAAETQGTALGAVMAQIVSDNALLIKTVPHRIADRLSKIAEEEYLKGIRPEETMEKMRKLAPHLSDFQLRRIARTESSKADTALVKARAEQLGMDWYIWRSSKDERVRSAHAQMDGVYVRWSDPPNPERIFKTGHDSGAPYHAGNIYNCRCIALPVVDEMDLHFPARVHVHGKIMTIGNIEAFRKLSGR